ncbi:MAG TPA: helix-turn-helix domain-containing protein [Caulobacteraceae bacterium]
MAVPLKSIAHRPASRTAGVREAASCYEEFAPANEVAVVAACTWRGQAGWARRFRLLPDGCADLIWDGRTLAILGAADIALRSRLRGESRPVGLRLRPGATGAVLGVSAMALPSIPIRLATIWGALAVDAEAGLKRAGGAEAQRRLLERVVACRLSDSGGPDAVMLEAARQLGSPRASVRAVARASGLDERDFRRRFADHAGLGPKRLQRVFRFGGLVRQLADLDAGRISAAALAVDLGYADQAHMVRECRRIAGATPGGLMRAWAA